MDFLGGMSNLLQNKLFLQYLSGAGGAIAAGQSPAPALGAITQQNIGAQSQAGLNKRYMDMLSGVLSGGEIPPGWKLARDEKGTKLDIPASSSAMGAPASAGIIGSMESSTPAGSPAMPDLSQLGTVNPFVSSQPGISAADLAGLGPQDVSRALAGATGVEALRQRSIANMLSARDPLSRDYPIPHPEAGVMSHRMWQSLPAEEKEFAAYVQTAKRLGAPAEELTRRFFSSLEPTEREKFVRAAMEDPTMMAAAKELSRAGATRVSIGEKIAGKVAEKKALGRLKGQLYFGDPKWIDDIDKRLGSEDIQRDIFMEAQRTGGDPELMKAEKAVKFIEDKISVGGTIQDVKLSEDGKTMIWTVKWKSGDVEDISYAVRP